MYRCADRRPDRHQEIGGLGDGSGGGGGSGPRGLPQIDVDQVVDADHPGRECGLGARGRGALNMVLQAFVTNGTSKLGGGGPTPQLRKCTGRGRRIPRFQIHCVYIFPYF